MKKVKVKITSFFIRNRSIIEIILGIIYEIASCLSDLSPESVTNCCIRVILWLILELWRKNKNT